MVYELLVIVWSGLALALVLLLLFYFFFSRVLVDCCLAKHYFRLDINFVLWCLSKSK